MLFTGITIHTAACPVAFSVASNSTAYLHVSLSVLEKFPDLIHVTHDIYNTHSVISFRSKQHITVHY